MTIFDLLSALHEKKTPWESLSEEDQKKFSPYLVNRWLSMNPAYLELISDLQKYTVGTLKPREVYKLYQHFLPKKKFYVNYIKGKKEGKYNKELIQYLCKYFECGSREVLLFLDHLTKEDITNVLSKYGLSDKEIKKLLK